jgi:hypothetical protein
MAKLGKKFRPTVLSLVLGALCTAGQLPAQGVRLLNPSAMEFTDQSSGVGFLYPPSWTFSLSQPFYMQLAISPGPDASDKDRLRALIYTTSVPGVAHWPRTHFEGLEFGYDAHSVRDAAACNALATPDNGDIGKMDEVTIEGRRFWHIAESNAGLGHGMSEDVFTTFSDGWCLRFDLAVSELNSDENGMLPRPLTPSEQALIDASLRRILNSVRIAHSAR